MQAVLEGHRTLRVGRPVKVAAGATVLAALLIDPFYVTGVLESRPDHPDLADFNVFYLAGRLILSGHFLDAYRPAIMASLERALAHGHDFFMPWSYPPLFGFVVAPLALLPFWLAYLVFTLLTLALFGTTLKRLGGDAFWPVFLATIPAVLINIRAGQNGLLTGGLYGLGALWLLRRRPVAAGSAMGCLAFKPHLAAMLPIMLLMQKRWLTLAAAGLTALGLTGLAVAVFGPETLSAFLASTREAGTYMAAGAYPLHRMTSIYAFALSLGASTTAAAVLHGAVAIPLLGWTAWMIHRSRDLRVQIGVAAMASPFLSPYVMDYDQTIFAVGLVCLSPALNRALGPTRYGLVLLCVALAQIMGIAVETLGGTISLGGPILLAASLVMLRTVRAEFMGSRSAAPAALSASAFSGSAQ